MDKDTAERIRYMIYKELCRTSMVDLCSEWNVSDEDVDGFLDAAVSTIEMKERERSLYAQ